ncbi:MAG TPA: RNA polymerase sigma-54 factor, partial [Nitrobacter sp.]|nr:RNA polymerase sigma-54 factor [Nitrobacter sp.]
MALTQKLEFRQSQSLVMTPQLMQAIKLLQLSNLDLSAYVEEELERNPLLERAGEDPDPPVPEPSAASDAEYSEGDEAAFDDHGGAERTGAQDPAPTPDEWMSRDLGSRAEIEQTFDSGLENVFPEEPA